MVQLAIAEPRLPNLWLQGAEIETVRQLAMASASQRGWSIMPHTGTRIAFERSVAGSVADLPPGSQALLRITADLRSDQDHVVVTLQAQLIEGSGGLGERPRDVTSRYHEQLEKALSSLHDRWASSPMRRDPQAPDQATGGPDQVALGTWAYYAERHAQAHGCQLGDTGAVLVSADSETELHRVNCRNGNSLWIRCHLGECLMAR